MTLDQARALVSLIAHAALIYDKGLAEPFYALKILNEAGMVKDSDIKSIDDVLAHTADKDRLVRACIKVWADKPCDKPNTCLVERIIKQAFPVA